MSAECYADGAPQYNSSASPVYAPCAQEREVLSEAVPCCYRGDTCLEAGLCLARGQPPTYYLAGCTDKTFKSPNCPGSYCVPPNDTNIYEVTYNIPSKTWRCSGGGKFHAPAPDEIKTLAQLPLIHASEAHTLAASIIHTYAPSTFAETAPLKSFEAGIPTWFSNHMPGDVHSWITAGEKTYSVAQYLPITSIAFSSTVTSSAPPPNAPAPHAVVHTSAESSPAQAGASKSKTSSSSSSNLGVDVGVPIAVVVVLVAVVVGILYWRRRKRRTATDQEARAPAPEVRNVPMAKSYASPELDSSPQTAELEARDTERGSGGSFWG